MRRGPRLRVVFIPRFSVDHQSVTPMTRANWLLISASIRAASALCRRQSRTRTSAALPVRLHLARSFVLPEHKSALAASLLVFPRAPSRCPAEVTHRCLALWA